MVECVENFGQCEHLFRLNYLIGSMATYCYHVANAAKKRVLKTLFDAYPKALTPPEISAITGMNYFNVSRLMNHYSNSPSHYIRRMKVKGSNGAFRYKLNKKGYRYLKEYTSRIKLGVGLNLKKNKIVYMDTYSGHKSVKIRSIADLELTPEQLAPYIRISKKGSIELGVQPEDKLRIVGIIRDKEEDKENDEPAKTLDDKRNKGKVRSKEASARGKTKPPIKPAKPSTRKASDKTPTKQKKEHKKHVMSEEKKYIVAELPEELEFPEKLYSFGDYTLTSREMAEIVVFAINKINKEMKTTNDARKLKQLQDKKRFYLLYSYNDDIKQFITVIKKGKAKASNRGW